VIAFRSGMPVDLSWLSDESIPLFFAFVGLQLLHESAHIAVAKAKNVSSSCTCRYNDNYIMQ